MGSLAVLPYAKATEGFTAGRIKGLAPQSDFMLESGIVYLQTGSTGATPRAVMNAAIEAWKDIETSPTHKVYGVYEDKMDAVRAKAATFLGCKTDELAFTKCTTEGLNDISQSLGLKSGDHVLTTDQEHPGGRCCWDYMVRTQGLRLDVVEIRPGENDVDAIISGFKKLIGPETRAIMFSHVLSSTGVRMPVAELASIARSKGILSIVDGAQSVGGIKVDVKSLGCDVYATSGHKWLLGPKGTGLVYVSQQAGKRVDPIFWQDGRKSYSESVGVNNIPGIMGLGAAIDYLNAIGIDKIESHNMALRRYLYQKLSPVVEAKVLSPETGPLGSPLLTYRLPDKDESGDLMKRLRLKHNVIVKMVPKMWFNGQRISCHLFNDEADIEAFIAALQQELNAS